MTIIMIRHTYILKLAGGYKIYKAINSVARWAITFGSQLDCMLLKALCRSNACSSTRIVAMVCLSWWNLFKDSSNVTHSPVLKVHSIIIVGTNTLFSKLQQRSKPLCKSSHNPRIIIILCLWNISDTWRKWWHPRAICMTLIAD